MMFLTACCVLVLSPNPGPISNASVFLDNISIVSVSSGASISSFFSSLTIKVGDFLAISFARRIGLIKREEYDVIALATFLGVAT